MATVRPISKKKLEANRANAQKSTGPRTNAGKGVSRMNAVTHGLLAQAVPITKGDYRENPQEFAQLLDDLRDQFTPVGEAEDIEVQTIARCYWRRMRAGRYEHGAIRARTGDLREREERRRQDSFNNALRFGFDLERSWLGIQYLLDTLEGAKRELRSGTRAGECFTWLREKFPDEFPEPDATELVQKEGRLVVTTDYVDEMVDTIDGELSRLAPLHAKIEETEELNLESKTGAAALPSAGVVNKLFRYETSNDRQLDRALQRLEAMQARRRKQEGAPAEK